MDWITPAIGATGGVLSSFIGGLFGSRSQRQQNEQQTLWNNQQLNFQKSMYEDQKNYNLEMWERENEYNDPSNQRKRLEAAGINPYMMMSGGSAGVASSANGVSPQSGANPGSAAHFDPSALATSAGTSIVSALNTLANNEAQEEVRAAQARQLRAESYLREIDGFTRAAENTERLEGMKSNRWNTDMGSLGKEQDYEFKRAAWSDMLAMKHEELLSQRQRRVNDEALNIGIALDNAAKNLSLKWQDKLAAAALAKELAQAKMFAQQSGLAYEQAKYTIEQRLKTASEKFGIDLNNNQIEQLIPIVIEKAGYERDRAMNNVGADSWVQYYQSMPDWVRRGIEFGAGFVGAGKVAGGIKALKSLKGVKAIKGFR